MVNQSKRERLLQIITAQPEYEQGRALVRVDEFFDGNDDFGSIGCNLGDHPGLDTFQRVLKEIVALPAVEQVWLQIYDIDEGDWPFSENVLIFGDAAEATIRPLVAILQPSEIRTLRMDWLPSRIPALANRRYANLWWD